MSRGWDPAPRLVGHRGSPREGPENTLASFAACARAGVRAVELDARLSADRRVVVHHDPELGRVIPGEGRVEDLASSDLRARGIPFLEEVLALGLLVDVEIKADAENAASLPARVLDAVRAADALDRVLVTSFDAELADEYARLSGRSAGMIVPYPPDVEDLASYPRLAWVALAEDAAIPEVVAAIRKAERRVMVWTVNDAATARRLLDTGVASVVTDRPGLLAKAIGEAGSAASPP